MEPVLVLAQGHNAVTPERLEPAALQSQVKHSTPEPLRSHNSQWEKKNTCNMKVISQRVAML